MNTERGAVCHRSVVEVVGKQDRLKRGEWDRTFGGEQKRGGFDHAMRACNYAALAWLAEAETQGDDIAAAEIFIERRASEGYPAGSAFGWYLKRGGAKRPKVAALARALLHSDPFVVVSAVEAAKGWPHLARLQAGPPAVDANPALLSLDDDIRRAVSSQTELFVERAASRTEGRESAIIALTHYADGVPTRAIDLLVARLRRGEDAAVKPLSWLGESFPQEVDRAIRAATTATCPPSRAPAPPTSPGTLSLYGDTGFNDAAETVIGCYVDGAKRCGARCGAPYVDALPPETVPCLMELASSGAIKRGCAQKRFP